MTSDESAPLPQNSESLDASTSTGLSLLAKAKWALLVCGIILVECAIAYFWLPDLSPSEVQAAATIGSIEEQIAQDQEAAQVEVDLGNFTVTAFQPSTSMTLRIDFHLYGTIAEVDHPKFLTLRDENEARLREQINVIVRGADVADLTDPGLGLIKRQILEKINHTLGKPLLKGVVFSEFSFIEQ